ncbi:MAG: hypothetical protein J0I79_11560 [Mesorhizobium sp.]|uniref:hypothetical protein n=1 Tax=Mesorhizobium sp. TaxID=1871066 RepID=UPI001AC25638|nr:hypothetical protein [Mesorhizobium sp.]MBN9218580.1 hypothetical protein [Mesorhizobium sp.]
MDATTVATEPGIFERLFAVVSVWTLTAPIPVSVIWGDSVWMMGFVGAIVAASLAFPRRLVELHGRFEHPIIYIQQNLRNDWTGLPYTKSNIRMIYNLAMAQKYHYILTLITLAHFMISGAKNEWFAGGYLVIFGAFSAISALLVSHFTRKIS